MQVNIPAWSGRLRISPQTLYQPQVNLPVAAYVLRRCIDDSGGDLWKGVGCYHSPAQGNQRKYVSRVWSAYRTLRQRGLFGPTLTVYKRRGAGVRGVRGADRDARRMPTPTPRPSPGRFAAPVAGPVATDASGLPACPGQQPQRRTAPGQGRTDVGLFSGRATLAVVGRDTPRLDYGAVCRLSSQ